MMTMLGSRQVAACVTAAIMGTTAFLLFKALSRASGPGHRSIRAAGPKQMRHPPRHWDMVDEQADQSFPASDPPGNY